MNPLAHLQVPRPAPADPISDRMVIIGCSRRKATTTVPVPALELYQGGSIPQLRARIRRQPRARARVRILSAEHGWLHPDTLLMPYDRRLDESRAAQLRPAVAAAIADDLTVSGLPAELLVIVEPLYLTVLADLLTLGLPIHWIPDVHAWDQAAAVLDRWEWP
ncbi:DUF6884 domain-containing protein [Microtetraspora malaysiensis]|uniref:DUF6884 domain-containing protein n=1 Tax=Microtetraspora malaysiensis TaxID=161358 RepID=A0ABW6SKK9_9ACTN